MMNDGKYYDEFFTKHAEFFQDDNPYKPNPRRQDIGGPISLGYLLGTTIEMGLFPEELNQHFLIFGRSGAGKTNWIRVIFQQLYNVVPIWFFDYKRDYRHFLQYAKNLYVIRWENLRFNPLRPPPGTDPKKWIMTFSDVFCLSFGLMAASKSLLVEILYELYELYGVFEGSDTYPSMITLHEMLDRKSRFKGLTYDERGYIARTKNKTLSSAILLRDVFDCDQGFHLEELLKKNVVFELDGLTDELQSFIVNSILVWIFTYRLEHGERG